MVTRPVDTSTEPTLDGAPGGGPRPGRRASWRRPQWPQGLAAVVAVGALAPAVLGLAWVVSQSVSSPLRADAPPEPLVVPVAAVARDQPVSVLLTVEHSAPFQAVVAGGGVVTDLHVGAGDEVEPGDRLVSIDDQVRVAFTAPATLWRDSGLGAEGEGVDRVRDFLAALDLPAGTVPGRATAATVEGARQPNQSVGRGRGGRVRGRGRGRGPGARLPGRAGPAGRDRAGARHRGDRGGDPPAQPVARPRRRRPGAAPRDPAVDRPGTDAGVAGTGRGRRPGRGRPGGTGGAEPPGSGHRGDRPTAPVARGRAGAPGR